MNKLEELKEQLAAKKNELESLQKNNLATWDEYGSELCTGDMLNQEAELELEILDIEHEIDKLFFDLRKDVGLVGVRDQTQSRLFARVLVRRHDFHKS